MKTKIHKVLARMAQSWVAFLIGAGLLFALYGGCYWIISQYAPRATSYFTVGAVLAFIACFFMLILNEPLVVWTMRLQRVRSRSDNPKLWDVMMHICPWHAGSVENGSVRLYVMPDRGMNAFAFGWGFPYMSAVTATSGIIEGLENDELAAVMAHEVGHIVNKDILVSMFLTLCVMVITFTGYLLMRIAPYGSSNSSSRDRNNNNGAIFLLAVLLVGGIMYILGQVFGAILQAFVSRQREYGADAWSAQTLGTPEPMIRALTKVVGNARMRSIKTSTQAFVGFLCTADPVPDDLMASHPNLHNRIHALRSLT